MITDQVTRLDTRSGQMVDCLLPRPTTPVTFWVGSNHGASIVKLEALD
jgi:hypothetical protein